MEFKLRRMGGEPTSTSQAYSHSYETNKKIQNFHFTEDQSVDKNETFTQEEIEDILKGDFHKVPLSPFYSITIFLLVPIIVAIVGIYLAINIWLVKITYSSYLQLSELFINDAPLTQQAIKAAPAILAFFGICYLFAPLIKSMVPRKSRTLDPEKEPIIYEYVNKLCKKLGAPPPKEICVDMEVNASVNYKHGFFSMFSGSTRLNIGLPLIEGMTLRQLSGILCHEIGHFTQGKSRIVTYILGTLYGWLATAYHKENLMEKIATRLYAPHRFILLKLIGRILWLVVIVPKLLFGLLAYIIYFSSMFLLRQMEYNADLYEAQAAGSAHFEQTSFELALLANSKHLTIDSLQRSSKNKRLSNDIPGLVATSRVIITDKEKQKIHQYMMEEKGSFGNTHPPTSKRIKNVMKYEYKGVIISQTSARRLLAQPEVYNQELTMKFYNFVLGKRALEKISIIPSHDLLNEMRETYKGWRSLNRYFQGVLHFTKPYEFKKSNLTTNNTETTIESLKTVRKKQEKLLADARKAHDLYLETLETKSMCFISRKLINLNLEQYANLICNQFVTTTIISEIERENRDFMKGAQQPLDQYFKLAKNRIELAIQLLNDEQFRSKMAHGDTCIRNINPILKNLDMMTSIQMPITNLDNNIQALSLLLAVGGESYTFLHSIFKLSDLLESGLFSLRQKLSSLQYPFEHNQENITLADFSVDYMPENDDLLGMYYTSIEMYDRLTQLYFRILGQLISIVEQVEITAGLEPLPDFKEYESVEEESN